MPKLISDISHEQFVEQSRKIHGPKFEYLSKYIKKHDKILIKCNDCGNLFNQQAKSHLNGVGCSKCSMKKVGDKLRYSVEEFETKCKQKYNNKYKYFQDYISSGNKIKILCKEHNCEFTIKAVIHLNKQGCPECAKQKIREKRQISYQDFENRAYDIHKGKYRYFHDYKFGRKKIKILCIKHNFEFYQLPYNHLNGAGCPKCNEPKGEKIISQILSLNNILFETQKTFDNCSIKKKLRFDFYIPEKNLCIEFDGYQHFNSIKKYGGKSYLKTIQKRDRFKDNFCKQNNIKLLRISYLEVKDIEKILIKEKIIN